jgi:hypothetical protein
MYTVPTYVPATVTVGNKEAERRANLEPQHPTGEQA